MIQDGSLGLAGGRLILGPKAERRFGRRRLYQTNRQGLLFKPARSGETMENGV